MTVREQLDRIDKALSSGNPWECVQLLQEYRDILAPYLILDSEEVSQ